MIGPTKTDWRARLLLLGSAAALGAITLATASPPAQARVWVSFGVPFPGYYPGPDPYYAYPPSPYYYAPPPAYYPPGAYPPVAAAPSAYTPYAPGQQPMPAYAPAGVAPTATAPAGSPRITYTSKPAFTNSAGQTCRQYKAADISGSRDAYGTACRQSDGQWRVVN